LTYEDGELKYAGDMFRELRKRAERRHGPITDKALAEQLGLSSGALRSYMSGRTMPKPMVLRALAELAGLRVSRVFVEMGWLPGHEVSAVRQHDLPAELEAATAAVARLSESLEGLPSRDSGRPALLAAAAVLGDARAATRFDVRLRALEAGERCPVATTVLAEFTPREGARPLEERELAERAMAAGLMPAAPGAGAERAGHRLYQTELEVVTAEALAGAGDFSWQGQPGTTLWQPVARRWPTHLLVQHVLTGQPFAGDRPWASTDGLPLVVVGADYSIGATAALLAKALGWRYVPVNSGTAFESGRLVRSQALAPAVRRRHGWSAAARRAGTLDGPGSPWPVVMLVRPYIFSDQDAYDEATRLLLRHVRARVVYARPSEAHIDWWARRRQLTARAARPTEAWKRDTYGALARVEEVLEQRAADRGPDFDLRLRLAPLAPAPDAADPVLPAQLVDGQLDCAARCLAWLDRVANRGRPSLRQQLRPSDLRTYLPRADTSGRTVGPWQPS
jgi:transcriptional regulator with XRE-family HTH domain